MFNTRLADGSSALLLDIGSVGNLMSYGWAREQATLAAGNGFKSTETQRQKPLRVSGVGHDHQICNKDGIVPVCLKDIEDKKASGTFEAPLIPGEMPALMGRVSLQKARTLIDIVSNKIYMLGPGDYTEALEAALPPGTRGFQTEISSSGHMMLPCAKFDSGTICKDKQGLKLYPELKLPVSTETASSSERPLSLDTFKTRNKFMKILVGSDE